MWGNEPKKITAVIAYDTSKLWFDVEVVVAVDFVVVVEKKMRLSWVSSEYVFGHGALM